MLKTGSDLDYAPSTLTLMSLLTRGPRRGPTAQGLFNAVLPRLDKLVQTGTDPEALTLKGKILRDQLKPREALSHFDRAIRVAAQKEQAAGSLTMDEGGNTRTLSNDMADPSANRAPRWPLEPMCYLERGHILLQMGRKNEAEKSFKVAAYELDIAGAYWELVHLLGDTPEREYCLLKAAVSGNRKACGILAEMEAEKAASLGPSGDAQMREDHLIKATEWHLLSKASVGNEQ